MSLYQTLDFTGEKVMDVNEDVPFDAEIVDAPLCRIVPNEPGMGMFSLRDYQHSAVDAFFECVNRVQSALIVLATGLGKTVCFAEIALRWPEELGRVLVIAHTEELIDQAAEKIGLHLDEACGIEMGERRETRGMLYGKTAKVLVGSVQTLARDKRRGKFNPKDFGLVVIDEGHHATAKSYRDVMMYFLRNPQCRILLVTATPERGDGNALGDVAKECCIDHGLLWGIDNGWLVDVKQKTITVEGLDFSKCRTTAGDLNEKDLEAAMMGKSVTGLSQEEVEEQEAMLHRVAKPVIDEASGRPTMIFCVTCDHAERMAEVCNRYDGVRAELVTGDTEKERRKDIINRFRSGQIQILCVVAIGVEGFDARVDVVAIAKPTKAKSRYLQMLGRGTRPIPRTVDGPATPEERKVAIAASAKASMTVLDFVGVAGKHQLISAVDVLAGEYEEDVIAAAKRRLKAGKTEDVRQALAASKEAIEAAKQKKVDRDNKRREQEEEERRQRAEEAKTRKHITAEVTYSAEDVPLGKVVIPETVGVGMYRGTASDGQVKLLMKLGVKASTACGYSIQQAGAVITKMKTRQGGDWIVTFGKHMGKPLHAVPKGYLEWMSKQDNPNPQLVKNYQMMKQGGSNDSPATSGSHSDVSNEVPF